MITGVIKNKVDKIWTDIWAGGITNPLTVIEQLTYLMFIRSLDEKELEAEDFENTMGGTMDKIFPQTEIGQSMRWSKFKDRDPREIYEKYIAPYFDDYPRWIRSVYYPAQFEAGNSWVIWQYCDTGELDGYKGGERFIDLDVLRRGTDLEALTVGESTDTE